MPRPPRILGVKMEFKDLRERFLVFEEGKPNKKFLKTLSSWLQMLLGSRNVLITYEGMAAATDLINTNLPAWERVLARQPFTLDFTLSMMPIKADFLELPKRIGRQR
jgi:hypothetical protein